MAALSSSSGGRYTSSGLFCLTMSLGVWGRDINHKQLINALCFSRSNSSSSIHPEWKECLPSSTTFLPMKPYPEKNESTKGDRVSHDLFHRYQKRNMSCTKHNCRYHLRHAFQLRSHTHLSSLSKMILQCLETAFRDTSIFRFVGLQECSHLPSSADIHSTRIT